MTGKTKFLMALAVTVIAAGLGLGLSHRSGNPKEALLTTEALAPTSPPRETRSTKNSPPALHNVAPGDVVDVKEWLEHGPKEPLVPPEIHVEAELAPGSIATSEPLAPPEIRIDAELAPGSSATLAPLSPPEIHVDPSAP